MPTNSPLKPVMFRLRSEDKDRLLRYCHRMRISQSAVMHNALMHYLDEREPLSDRLAALKAPEEC